jgi:exodeoxyribonuclease VII small subunit
MARSAARPASEPELTFEGALARLEAIVSELESGDLELERALAAFEEGVALSRRCAGQLEDAERRIERLMSEPAPKGQTGD